MRLCSLCGGKVPKGLDYPLVTCRECEKRAVNVYGRPPEIHHVDEGDNPVFIDGLKFWRRYRMGIDPTMLDVFDCSDVIEFQDQVFLRWQDREPATYLLIANKIQPFAGKAMPAAEVFDLMMAHECWEFGEQAPFFRKMAEGDHLVFYLGGAGHRYFAGEAEVAGPGVPIAATSTTTFDRQQVPWFSIRMPLRNIRRYPRQGNAVETLTRLSFARNTTLDPKYIGLLLRLGVRRLTPADLLRIRESVGLSPWEQKRSS